MVCLVTAATGYPGSRLVPRLLAEGYRVRCVVDAPERLRDVPWAGEVEVVLGGDNDRDRVLREACRGVDVVYFLRDCPHSRGSAEREAARQTARAASEAGVSRIVSLAVPRAVRPHRRDRGQSVDEILLDCAVPAAVIRASLIIGSGSPSFEALRHLTDRLPVMVTPGWVHNTVQPLAVQDLLHYLVRAAELDPEVNRSFDVGGPEVLRCAEIIQRYASVAGLPARRMFGVRVVSPKLSAFWISAVTPVPKAVGERLVGCLVHEGICRERDIDRYIAPPAGGLTPYDTAVTLALSHGDAAPTTGAVAEDETTSAAGASPSDPPWAGEAGYTDTRTRRVTAPVRSVWQAIDLLDERGEWPLLTALRLLPVTGPQGRQLRVESRTEGKLVRFRVASGLPGRVWLELSAVPHSRGGAVYHQRAIFQPRGLGGHLAWWATGLLRGIALDVMARDIARRAAAHGSDTRPLNKLARPAR